MNFYDPKPKKKPVLGSEILQALFENGKSPLSAQFLRWKIWGRWSEFVGPTIAQNTEPVGYYKGTLYIWVRHSTLMQQLYFIKDQLIESVNGKVGTTYVTDIRFTLDKRAAPKTNPDELKRVIEKIVPETED